MPTAADDLTACRGLWNHLQPLAAASAGLRVDPRLFGERYCELEGDEPCGASVSNIHPGDLASLPAVYTAICRGVIKNLVEMAPPEVC